MAYNPNEKKVAAKNYSSTKRIPLGIVCDISSSMADVQEVVNKLLKDLIIQLKNSSTFGKSVDLLIMFYNGDTDVRVNFEKLEDVNVNSITIVKTTGYTDTGKALLEALRLLGEKKKEYQSNIVEYYQPNLFLITDGYPCAWQGAPDEEYVKINRKYELAAEEIQRMVNNNKLVFAAAGIQRKNGSSANMKRLRELSPYVVCVSEEFNDMKKIETFFKLISMTMGADTEIAKVMRELFD